MEIYLEISQKRRQNSDILKIRGGFEGREKVRTVQAEFVFRTDGYYCIFTKRIKIVQIANSETVSSVTHELFLLSRMPVQPLSLKRAASKTFGNSPAKRPRADNDPLNDFRAEWNRYQRRKSSERTKAIAKSDSISKIAEGLKYDLCQDSMKNTTPLRSTTLRSCRRLDMHGEFESKLGCEKDFILSNAESTDSGLDSDTYKSESESTTAELPMFSPPRYLAYGAVDTCDNGSPTRLPRHCSDTALLQKASTGFMTQHFSSTTAIAEENGKKRFYSRTKFPTNCHVFQKHDALLPIRPHQGQLTFDL